MTLRPTTARLTVATGALLGALVAPSAASAAEFQPQNEFKIKGDGATWIDLPGPMDLNKAVFLMLVATAFAVGTMIYIAKRMQARPNRVQTAIETAYILMRDTITRGNMDARMAAKWFPFIATIFLFIWFNNMLGYLPLPTNTEHKVDLGFITVPSLALYAATANLAVPLVLTLAVFFSYTIEGVRAKGPIGYLKGLVPAGVTGAAAAPIFFIELISQFVRIVSLSVRLFANILAGHLLILFMGGGLVVLLSQSEVISGFVPALILGAVTGALAVVFFIFEVGLVASLQAFIFATLSSIYLGEAVAEEH